MLSSSPEANLVDVGDDDDDDADCAIGNANCNVCL
jgi:hypothetical protein